jgi:predicted dehydrogenase
MHTQAIVQNRSRGEVVAVADVSKERREAFPEQMKEWGVTRPPRVYESAEKLIADPEVDAVCVALPNYLHAPVALRAIKQGKHVFTEKPPTMNAAEAKRIQSAVEKTGVTYMYVCQRRYDPSAVALRAAIEKGALGEVYHGKATWARARGIPIGAGGWFVDKKRAGGGALIDIGVHMLDAAWYFMGSPRPISVSGSAYTKLNHLVPKGVHFDVDDFAIGIVKFENGATILLEASWALNQKENDRMGVTLYGTKAGAAYAPAVIYARGKNGTLKERAVKGRKGRKSDFGLMIEHFLQCIETGEEPRSSAREAVALMQMLDGLYRSSRTGREIRLR